LLVHAGRLEGLAPEAGGGEEPGFALRVVNDRDLEAPVVRELPAGQPLAEEGEVGEFLDDGLDDVSPALRRRGRRRA
jgi:hypothetical protein